MAPAPGRVAGWAMVGVVLLVCALSARSGAKLPSLGAKLPSLRRVLAVTQKNATAPAVVDTCDVKVSADYPTGMLMTWEQLRGGGVTMHMVVRRLSPCPPPRVDAAGRTNARTHARARTSPTTTRTQRAHALAPDAPVNLLACLPVGALAAWCYSHPCA